MGHDPALPHRARTTPAEGRPRLDRRRRRRRLRRLRVRCSRRAPGHEHRQPRLDRGVSSSDDPYGDVESSSSFDVRPELRLAVRQLVPIRPERWVMTGFRSMGCDVLVSSADRLRRGARLFEERDRRFSRFYDHSELNHVNAHPFGVTLVSEELASMLSLALDAAHATDGLVTPAVGGAIVAAGYDRDFASLPLDGDAVEPAPVPSLLSLSLRGRMLLRTEPVVLDLNGVVKSKTVDDALALHRRRLGLRRRRRRDDGPARRRPARRRLDPPRPRRARDEQRREAQLASRRRAAAPPDRSGHRSTGAHTLARRHRGRPRLRRGRRCREGRPPPRAGPGRRGSTGAASPAASSTTTAQSSSTQTWQQCAPDRLAA